MSENMGSSGMGGGATESTGEHARKTYDAAREKAQQVIGQVRERAGAYYQQGREKAVDYQHRVEDMVREQPMKSVLIAVGAGLVLGMLLRRR